MYYPSNEDQKDAFQEVVLQLWKSIKAFRGESEIGTWIYRITLNTLLSQKRKEKRLISTEGMDGLPQVVAAYHADDDLELLQLIIHSLKDLDKAIVVSYLEGYKTKEIAEMLNLSSSNVTTRFNRIKSQLKAKLNRKIHEARQS